MSRPSRTATRRFALALLTLILTSPAALDAQRTSGRNLRIAYESGGPNRNGYADAQVEVTYYFGRCADRVMFHATYNPQPHMLVGNHRYWYNGRMMEVPPHIAPPRLSAPVIRGTVRGNGIAKEISFVHANTSAPDCFANNLSFGMATDFWPVGTTEDRQLAILNGFGFDQQGTLPPLRNSAAEAHFSQVLSAAREDSIARARAAEAQRQAARRDSIARADQQRRAASASAVSAATTGQASSTAGAAQTSAAGTGSTAMSDAEREAAERAAAQERARIAMEDYQRRVAEEEARNKQREEAYVATATAAAGLISGLLEAREERQFRKALEEAERQRAQQARYQAYGAATKARFDAAPAQPRCTAADARETIELGAMRSRRTITLAMDQCRAAGGQNSVLLELVLDADAPVAISPSSSAVTPVVYVVDASTSQAVAAGSTEGISRNLTKGRYLLVVTSSLPGEIGDIEVSMRKAMISDAHGSVGGAGAAAKTIHGFVGTNQTSTSWMDLNLTLEFRRWLPALTFNVLYPTDTEASEEAVDVGLRKYLLRNGARWRPWIEASVGYRSVMVRQEPFTTVSPAFGAGIHWRVSDEYGLALSATQITGKAKNTDDIWTSPPPPVPLGRTIFRLGLMIH